LKSAGLWQVVQIAEGVFMWTSRLGRVYIVRPETVDEFDLDLAPG